MTESYIAFPKLGINLSIDNVAFTIGEKEIYWYGIIIAFGFFVAVLAALKLAKSYGMSSDTVIDIVIFAAPVGIVCARLYYVIFEWDYYSAHPEDIIKIWNGGLAIYGAIISAVLVAVIYCKIKNQNLALFCDIGAVSLLIGQSIGRWGNFVNQEAFGGNTDLPWGMTGDVIISELKDLASSGVNVNPDLPVHPTFLYESLWNLIFIVVFLLLFKKRRFDGQIFLGYLMSYGVGRFFIEGLRTDSLYLGSIRVSQLVAVLCFALGLALMIFNLKRPVKKLTLPVSPAEKVQEE